MAFSHLANDRSRHHVAERSSYIGRHGRSRHHVAERDPCALEGIRFGLEVCALDPGDDFNILLGQRKLAEHCIDEECEREVMHVCCLSNGGVLHSNHMCVSCHVHVIAFLVCGQSVNNTFMI